MIGLEDKGEGLKKTTRDSYEHANDLPGPTRRDDTPGRIEPSGVVPNSTSKRSQSNELSPSR